MTAQDTTPIGGACECSQAEQLFLRLGDAAEDDGRREWRRGIVLASLPLADQIAYRFVGSGELSENMIHVSRSMSWSEFSRPAPGLVRAAREAEPRAREWHFPTTTNRHTSKIITAMVVKEL